MAKIIIRRKIQIPMIGTWEWAKDDYKIPLVFNLSGVKVLLYLDEMWDDLDSRQRKSTWDAILELHFESASRRLINGLTTSGK